MTTSIQLTQGMVAVIDTADLPLVHGYRWHVAKRKHTAYAAAWVPGTRRKVLMHRLLAGATDPSIEVDHHDGNGLNNRRSNLRSTTKSGNMHNLKKHRDGKSRFKGVIPCPERKKPWMAQIHPPGGKNTSEVLASRSIVGAGRFFLCGEPAEIEFAKTNFEAAA